MPDVTLNDDRLYSVQAERLVRLHAGRSELDGQISEAAAEYAAWHGQDRLTGAALALLDGEGVEDAAHNPEERLQELTLHRDILDKAIQFQNQRLSDEQVEASARITKKLKPEYNQLIGRVVTATRELAEAADAAWIFMDSLSTRGIFVGWFQPLTGVTLRDPNSRANYWLGEAERHGIEPVALTGNGKRPKRTKRVKK